METFPWRRTSGFNTVRRNCTIINAVKLLCLFTNTRSHVEYGLKVLEKHPIRPGDIAMPTGSINKETRVWVTKHSKWQSLKQWFLAPLVSLGVDFAL